MANPIHLSIPGPGPFGFRLSGGDAVPLAVAKLRKKSKASELGLREGDLVLGINGRSCQLISHANAVKLLTSSDKQLDLYITRDISDPFAISEAFQKLQAVLRPLSPQQHESTTKSTNDATSSFSCYMHSAAAAQNTETASYSRDNTSVQHFDNTISAEPVVEPQFLAAISEREQTKQQFLQRAKQHTEYQIQLHPFDSQRKFSLDEETIVYRHVPNLPQQDIGADVSDRPRKSLDDLRGRQRGSNGPKFSRAPKATVSLSWPKPPDETAADDQPKEVTPIPYVITYNGSLPRSFGSAANFKVSNISATPWVWKPEHGPRVSNQKPVDEIQLHKVSISDALLDELIAKHSPDYQSQKELDEDSDIKRLHLIKILTSLDDEDSIYNAHKKKIFADSSFYDDPEHKYPTIEEQIKMARKVALSLTAPGNITARGHRMFMKRKERAQYWDINNPVYQQETAKGNPYYNPTPWLSTVVKKHASTKSEKNRDDDIQKPSKRSTNRYPRKFDSNREGSANENSTSGVRVNFSISDELTSPRSKAGKLFQKRRAKSEEPADNPYIQKYDSSYFSLRRPVQMWTETLEPASNGPQVSCRLKDMIREYEVRKDPYYTGIGLGNIDFSIDLTNGPQLNGWSNENSAKGESQGKGSRSKWAVTKSSRSSYGPVGYRKSRKFGSVPSLHSPPLVGPITDF